MVKALILVEGQTEETFVKTVLYPYLAKKSFYCIPILATTKRVKSGPDFKGGIVSYEKTKNDIKRLLHDSSATIVTTMIDYYGFAYKVPYQDSIQGQSCFERVKSLEELFKDDIDHNKFYPYLQLHEFEALVFVSPREVAGAFPNTNKEGDIVNIVRQFNSPEEIDDGPTTAPSKRLKQLFPSYQKPLHSSLITNRIGLDKIREKCKHFNRWVKSLEQFISNNK